MNTGNENPIKIKYFKGQLHSEQMRNRDWLAHWIAEAEELEKDGYSLAIFKVPQNKILQWPDGSNIEEIEKFLQQTLD